MAIRNRTTKSVAKRHDLDYFKKGSPVRLWQWWLTLAAVCAAVLWLGVSVLRHGDRMFSAGPMSSAHAVFGQKCVACHQPVIAGAGWLPVFGSSKRVPDSACLNCHAAPAHHPATAAFTPKCGSCHIEHQGSMRLASVADVTCTQCHADLKVRSGSLTVPSGIHSFVNGHPDFRPLQGIGDASREAAFSLRFNHAEHMKSGLSGPRGKVDMRCSDCHRTPNDASSVVWRFQGAPESTPQMKDTEFEGTQATGAVSSLAASARMVRVAQSARPDVHAGGAYMKPASYQQTCRACHTLRFDSHISAEAPHADPATVQKFVVAEIASYAVTHPQVVANEIENWQGMSDIAGRMPWPAPHTPQEWIAARVAHADRLLWRGKCSLCHQITGGEIASISSRAVLRNASLEVSAPASISAADQAALPVVAPTQQPQRWFADSVFRHDAHQEVQCAQCHANALSSTTGKDVLLPSIAVCQRCHDGATRPQGPPVSTGHAESGCFLCHQYHGWTQAAMAVEGQPHRVFTLDELTSKR